MAIERFFREYLPTLRDTSRHTIRNYQDVVVLFLRFVSTQKTKAIEYLDLGDFAAQQVRDFFAFLEAERRNGVATRNARLAALHRLARFLATEQPAHLAELQRVLGCGSNVADATLRLNMLKKHIATSVAATGTKAHPPAFPAPHDGYFSAQCRRRLCDDQPMVGACVAADLDLKRQALMQVFPEILAPPRTGQMSTAPSTLSTD
jgi:hypothetical protein